MNMNRRQRILLALLASSTAAPSTAFVVTPSSSVRTSSRTASSSCSPSRLYVSSTTDEATEKKKNPATTPAGLDEEMSEIIQEQQVKGQSTMLMKVYEKIGSIPEERFVFPELNNGEVPRMYSSLEYTKCEETGTVKAVSHAPGSVLGAAALIAGTTVGAGVLALPAATAPAGFLPSSAAMMVAYGYMVVSGLLIAELTLNRIGTTGRPGTGLLALYENALPGKTSWIGTGAYFFLHYAMMVAYIAQGGNNLAGILPGDLPAGAGQVAFAALTGGALYAANANAVEKVNNVLVAGVVGTFVALMAATAGSADFGALIASANQHPEQVVNCFPILFLAFVYQNVVPTVVTQLEGDRKKITQAIIGGTAVPLLMFLAWNAVILGNVLGAGGVDLDSVDPVALLQSGTVGSVGPLVTAFSSVALLTSIIGFTYGLLDAWTDMFKIQYNEKNTEFQKWKPALFALIFVPPVALSVTDPSVFYTALEYGGAFGVSTLFLVLPPIMIWKERYGEDQADKPLISKPMVPLGKIPLGSMWKAAGTLIIEQGAEKLGFFEWFQEHFHFHL